MMLLGGISSDRKYTLATYSSDDGFNPIVYQPKVCEHYLRIALPFGVLSDYNKLINKYFDASPKNPKDLDNKMIDFIKEVAEIDDTVNRTMFRTQVVKQIR